MQYVQRIFKYIMAYQLPLKMMAMKNMQLHREMCKWKKQEKNHVQNHFNYMKKMQRMREIHQMFRVAASVCCNYA